MRCLIWSETDKDGLRRRFRCNRLILKNGGLIRISIDAWMEGTLGSKRKLERVDPMAARFLTLLGDVLCLQDEVILEEDSFTLVALTPESWRVLEAAVLNAFQEAYRFDEVHTVEVAPA